MKNRIISTLIGIAALLMFAASGNAAAERLYVYKDANDPENHGAWGNVMPARAAETDSVSIRTAIEHGFDGKGTAVQIKFVNLNDPPNWVGMVVSVQADYWGDTNLPGLDLTKAKKLVFYAKGEQGGEQIQVKAAIVGDKPFGDSADFPISSKEWITLDKGWKKYEIPVDGSQLKRVITPFVLIANKAHNLEGKLTFYVDEIYYELSK